MFKWTLQQEKWFKEGAYIKCKKQRHYMRNYKGS